jgi:hypothetical protein
MLNKRINVREMALLSLWHAYRILYLDFSREGAQREVWTTAAERRKDSVV